MLTYWSRVLRFALGGRLPRVADEVPVWALCVPYRHWRDPKRYDGRTFADAYGASVGRLGRLVLPLRFLYLVFLLAWPLVALLRAPLRGRDAVRFYRNALFRPELALAHPNGVDTEDEVRKGRPDYALAMFYAHTWATQKPAWMWLDDKRHFLRDCAAAGFPLPPTLPAAEAIARGGTFVVKDPEEDLGYGVEILDSKELAGIEWRDELIVQERLRNHPVLREVLGEEAPLSSLRVLTLVDPRTGQLGVMRTAIRIGRHGSPVDNTQQGGIWASVDKRTGLILPGVTRATYGNVENGAFVRFSEHPDSHGRFVGVRVPWFDEGRAMALAAHAKLTPDALALGWDVALAETGPVLLEVNVWATCYDYDPVDDAFGPTCEGIVKRLALATR